MDVHPGARTCRLHPLACAVPVWCLSAMSRVPAHPVLRLVGADVASAQQSVPDPHPGESVQCTASPGPPPARQRVVQFGALAALQTARTNDRGSRAERAARAEVARENLLASTLSPGDARWLMAVRTASCLEGGQAAFLPQDRRRALMAEGARVGLRPFDTSLIIAIVQDNARRGLTALGEESRSMLTLVGQAHDASGGLEPGRMINATLAGVVLGVVWAYLLIGWVLGQ